MTGALIFIPTLYFFFCEFEEYAIGERILLSLFQAVTPRTAGFNTAKLGLISEVGLLLMIFLMLVGVRKLYYQWTLRAQSPLLSASRIEADHHLHSEA